MGLSNFPSPAGGVLPVLVMNTVFSVTLLKNIVRSVLQVAGDNSENSPNIEEDLDPNGYFADHQNINGRERRISITQFKSLLCQTSTMSCDNSSSTNNRILMECCVCLCGFEEEEEVSELSCKHFFHKQCLEKWFLNKDSATCPLCRS